MHEFAGHGLALKYPDGFRLWVTPRLGRGQNIKVEGKGVHGRMFGIVVQTYDTPISVEKAHADVLAGIELTYSGDPTGIRGRTPVQRRLGGSLREGVRFDIVWDGNPAIEVFTFALPPAGTVLSVSVQYDADDHARADGDLAQILESIA